MIQVIGMLLGWCGLAVMVGFALSNDVPPPPQPCAHVKVYSNSVVLTMPPIYKWICEKCGTKGEERAVSPVLGPTYEELERQFQPKPTP